MKENKGRMYWTQEDKDNLVELRMQGKTYKEISIILGISIKKVSSMYHNIRTRTAPSMEQKRWTKEEVNDLTRMRAEGKKLREIAEILDRNIGSVTGKWAEIKPETKPIKKEKEAERYPPWEISETENLCFLKKQGLSSEDIAERMGRTVNSIEKKWAKEKETVMFELLQEDNVICPLCESRKNIGLVRTFINWKIVTMYYCNDCLREFDEQQVLEPMLI